MSQELLSTALANELNTVSAFVELLKSEQVLLTSNHTSNTPHPIGDLQSITDQKNNLIDQLTQCAQTRDALVRQAGFPETGDGIQSYLSVLCNPGLDATFAALKAQASEANRLNALNAKLVAMRLQVTQQALSILLPQEHAPALYDVQGQTAQRVGYKLIDSA